MSRRRTKGNSLYIHRPAYAEVRALILGREGPGRNQRANAAGTFLHLLMIADDPEGTIARSDRSIARSLGVARPTWGAHRDILLGCGVLARSDQLWVNQYDEQITYIIPLFDKIRGLRAGTETEPAYAHGGQVAGQGGGKGGGKGGGLETWPAHPPSPAPSRPDLQDPQDLQDQQDTSWLESERQRHSQCIACGGTLRYGACVVPSCSESISLTEAKNRSVKETQRLAEDVVKAVEEPTREGAP